MGQRRLLLDLELRTILKEATGAESTDNVHIYYNPPASVKMQYDCIRYNEETMNLRYADDKAQFIRPEYNVIVITRDADSPIPEMIQKHFTYCRPGRKYSADNLYHYPFTIVY